MTTTTASEKHLTSTVLTRRLVLDGEAVCADLPVADAGQGEGQLRAVGDQGPAEAMPAVPADEALGGAAAFSHRQTASGARRVWRKEEQGSERVHLYSELCVRLSQSIVSYWTTGAPAFRAHAAVRQKLIRAETCLRNVELCERG